MGDNGSDIYATDDEGPSSAALVQVATTRKRRKTARIHASRPGRPQTKRTKRTTAVELPAASASASAPGNWAQVKRIDGDCAPFNDKSTYIDDPINHRTFMFGGIEPVDEGPDNKSPENNDSDDEDPEDEGGNPTSDFYCCDTTSMRWKNLTDSLTFRNLENPFADEKATLPLLSHPGGALVRIRVKDEYKSFILIFGGFDPEAGVSTSNVFVIDPDALTWWYLNIKGEGVKPRIGPTVTSVGNDVFVFGGYKHFEGDCGSLNSYNILSYDPNRHSWEWRVRDRPYGYKNAHNQPNQRLPLIPTNHAFGAAIPVYEGKKILLLPGRHTKNDKITFTPLNIFYYHIANESFQSATRDFAGSFPRDMSWYYAYEYCKPSTTPNAHSVHSNGSASALWPASDQSSMTSPNVKRPRGRPRKNQAAGKQTRLSMSTSASASRSKVSGLTHSRNLYSSPTSPSIIICGWIDADFGGKEELAPELWHLFLSPEDRVVCLNMAKHTWGLDHDFQMFFCMGGRPRLLGAGPVEVDGNKQTDEQDTQTKRFDIYVDLPY